MEEEHIDLLLSDIVMPDMGGYQLAAIVSEKYPHIKIQLVSGFTNEDSDTDSVDSGFQSTLIKKPYKAQFLLAIVRNLLDGQRLNADLSGGAREFDHFISLANVKQVEVIRGPGSALYGTSAFTGVVNIITDPALNEIFASTGNLGSDEVYINASTALGNSNIALFARHFGDTGQSYGEQYTFKVNPDIGSVSDPRDGTEIYLSYDWDDRLDIHLRYLERTEEEFFTGLRSEAFPDDKVEVEKYYLFLKYRAWQTEQWRVDVSGNFSRSKLDSLTRKKTGLTSFQSRLLFEEQEWGLNIDAHFFMNDHNEFSFGVEWRNPDLTKARAFDNLADPGGALVFTGTNRIAEGDRRIFGIYLQQQYRFGANLELTLGVRNDDYSDFGGSISPRAALVYSTDFDATFKVIYGEAFRAPSLRQSGSTEVGNPDLQPETVKTIEFAYIQAFKNVQTGITYFHSEYEDKITTIPRPTGPGRIFDNIGDSTASGFELDAIAQIGNLTVRGAYTNLLKTEKAPHFVAEQTFSLIANYRLRRWNFNLNGYYHDDMQQNAMVPGVGSTTVRIDDYWVWNLTTRYGLTAFNRQFTIEGRVENLFDEGFASPTRIRDFFEGLPNRGRIASLGIEMQF